MVACTVYCVLLFTSTAGQGFDSAEVGDLHDDCKDFQDRPFWRTIGWRAWSWSLLALGQIQRGNGFLNAAGKSFRSAIKADPCYSAAHFSLASLLLDRGNSKGAERTFANAVLADPAHWGAVYNLGSLLYKRGEMKRAEEQFTNALAMQPGNWMVQRALGALLAVPCANQMETNVCVDRSEEAEKHLRAAAAALLRVGRPLQALLMNLDHLGAHGLQNARRQEVVSFDIVCQTSESLAPLPDVLTALRDLENSTEWLVKYRMEVVRSFGNPHGPSPGDYGITWFPAWQAVAARPSVAAALRRPNATVLLVGSALGYQCLFAIALGAQRCVGYDVLCESMVKPANDVIKDYGLEDRLEFHCADAREAKGLEHVALLWMNDESYPLQLRKELQLKAARELPTGSAVVIYGSRAIPDDSVHSQQLPFVDTVEVGVSWDDRFRLKILRREPSVVSDSMLEGRAAVLEPAADTQSQEL